MRSSSVRVFETRPFPAQLSRGIPLSPGQQRLWFADLWQPGLAAYNLPAAFRLRKAPDAEIVRRAIREILRRHEALRTTFRMNGNAPVQDIQSQIEPEFHIVPIPDSALNGIQRSAGSPRSKAADLSI